MLAALLAVLAGILVSPAVGGVSSDAVGYSLTRKLGGNLGLSAGTCSRHSSATFDCNPPDPSGSGAAEYRVRLDGDCWTARRLSSGWEGEQPPGVTDGCVRLRDQLRVLSRF